MSSSNKTGAARSFSEWRENRANNLNSSGKTSGQSTQRSRDTSEPSISYSDWREKRSEGLKSGGTPSDSWRVQQSQASREDEIYNALTAGMQQNQVRKDENGYNTNDQRDALLGQLRNFQSQRYLFADPDAQVEYARQVKEFTDQLDAIDAQLGNPAQYYDSTQRGAAVGSNLAKNFAGSNLEAVGTLGEFGREGDLRQVVENARSAPLPEDAAGMLGLGAANGGVVQAPTRTIFDLPAHLANAFEVSSEGAETMLGYGDGRSWEEIGGPIVAPPTDPNQPKNWLQMTEAERSAAMRSRGGQWLDEAAEGRAKEREGLNKAQSFGLDIVEGGMDLAADQAANLIVPGMGMVEMGVRTFGSAAHEVAKNGGDINQQFTAGAKAAAIEILTEKVSEIGGVRSASGKGWIDGFVDDMIDKAAKNGRLAAFSANVIAAFGSEAFEEALSGVLNSVADYALGLEDSVNIDWGQVFYEALTGGVLGIFGGVSKGVQYNSQQKAQILRDAVAQAAAQQNHAASSVTGLIKNSPDPNNKAQKYVATQLEALDEAAAKNIASDNRYVSAFEDLTDLPLSGTPEQIAKQILDYAQEAAGASQSAEGEITPPAPAEAPTQAQDALNSNQSEIAPPEAAEQATNPATEALLNPVVPGQAPAEAQPPLSGQEALLQETGILPEAEQQKPKLPRNSKKAAKEDVRALIEQDMLKQQQYEETEEDLPYIEADEFYDGTDSDATARLDAQRTQEILERADRLIQETKSESADQEESQAANETDEAFKDAVEHFRAVFDDQPVERSKFINGQNTYGEYSAQERADILNAIDGTDSYYVRDGEVVKERTYDTTRAERENDRSTNLPSNFRKPGKAKTEKLSAGPAMFNQAAELDKADIKSGTEVLHKSGSVGKIVSVTGNSVYVDFGSGIAEPYSKKDFTKFFRSTKLAENGTISQNSKGGKDNAVSQGRDTRIRGADAGEHQADQGKVEGQDNGGDAGRNSPGMAQGVQQGASGTLRNNSGVQGLSFEERKSSANSIKGRVLRRKTTKILDDLGKGKITADEATKLFRDQWEYARTDSDKLNLIKAAGGSVVKVDDALSYIRDAVKNAQKSNPNTTAYIVNSEICKAAFCTEKGTVYINQASASALMVQHNVTMQQIVDHEYRHADFKRLGINGDNAKDWLFSKFAGDQIALDALDKAYIYHRDIGHKGEPDITLWEEVACDFLSNNDRVCSDPKMFKTIESSLKQFMKAYELSAAQANWAKPASNAKPKFFGAMSFAYGKMGNSRINQLGIKSTLEAIQKGERTSTTRFEKDGHIDYWKKAKVGDRIKFSDKNGNSVVVEVTVPLHKIDASNFDIHEWSSKEGWSEEWARKNLVPKIDQAWQMEYKYVGDESGTSAYGDNTDMDAEIDQMLSGLDEEAYEMEQREKRRIEDEYQEKRWGDKHSIDNAKGWEQQERQRAKAEQEQTTGPKYAVREQLGSEAHDAVNRAARSLAKDTSEPIKGDESKRKLSKHYAKAQSVITAMSDFAEGNASFSDLVEEYGKLEGTAFYDESTHDQLKAVKDMLDTEEKQWRHVAEDGRFVDNTGKTGGQYKAETAEAVAKAVQQINHRVKRAGEVGVKPRAELNGDIRAGAKGRAKTTTKFIEKFTGMQLRPDVMFKKLGGFVKDSAPYQLAEKHMQAIKDKQNQKQAALEYFISATKMKGYEDFAKGKTTIKNPVPGHGDSQLSLNTALGLLKTLETNGAIDHIVKNADNGGVQFAASEKELYNGAHNNGFGDKASYGQTLSMLSDKTIERLANAKSGKEIAHARATAQLELEALRDNLKAEVMKNEVAKAMYNASFNCMRYLGMNMNDASQTMWGVDFATEGRNYYPLEIASQGKVRELLNDPRGGLKNMGIVQERTGASGALRIRPFTDVMSHYIEQSTDWSAFSVLSDELELLSRNNGGGDIGLTATIGNEYGKFYADWLDNYVKDLNGTREGGVQFSGLRSNLASAALTLNGGVALKQSPSYFDAAGIIDMGILLKHSPGLLKTAKSFENNPLIQEVEMRTGMLGQRKLGYNAVEVGEATESARGLSTKVNKLLPNWMTNWITKTDVRTTSNLMLACADQVMAESAERRGPKVERGSEEYYRAIADKFEQVILQSQPVYTKQARADYMRNPSDVIRTLAMFRTQQTQNFNQLVEAIGEYQNATGANKEKAGKHLVTVASGQVIASAMFSVLSAVARAGLHKFDDFKDDEGWSEEKIAKRLGLNMLGSVAGTVWGGGELASFAVDVLSAGDTSEFQGLDDNVMSMLTDAATSVISWSGDKKDLVKIKNLVLNISNAFGIPARNAYNMINSVVMFGLDRSRAANGGAVWDSGKSSDFIKMLNDYNEQDDKKRAKATFDVAMRAMAAGDDARYTALMSTLDYENDDVVDAIKTSARERFALGEIDMATYKQILTKWGKMTASDAQAYVEGQEEKKELKELMADDKVAQLDQQISDAKDRADEYDSSRDYAAMDLIIGALLSDVDTDRLVKAKTSKGYRTSYEAMRQTGMSPAEASTTYKAMDGDNNGSLKQDELVEYYLANPGMEYIIKQIWATKGWKTSWEAKRDKAK